MLPFSVTEWGLFLQTSKFSVDTDDWLVLQFYFVLTLCMELQYQILETHQHFMPCCVSRLSSFFLTHRLYLIKFNHLFRTASPLERCVFAVFLVYYTARWDTYLCSHRHGNSLKRQLSFNESLLPQQNWVHSWPLLTESAAPFFWRFGLQVESSKFLILAVTIGIWCCAHIIHRRIWYQQLTKFLIKQSW